MQDIPFGMWAFGIAVLWALALPNWGAALHDKVMAWFAVLGRNPRRFTLLCGLTAGVGAALAASLVYWPAPSIHDEFAYLLAGETFAGGRLTNPTHPMWHFFETFHVIHEPSYMAKYPPAQGLSLALGIALGDAVYGLWIQAALMSGAVAWMMFGWLPRRWAVLGSVVLVLRLGVGGYWVQTFWGGALATTAGALVFGALPRVLRRPNVPHAVALALGVALLANTRPFEGLLTALPVGGVVLIWMVRNRGRRDLKFVRRLVLPVLLVLIGTGSCMAYYNYRVTGDPLVLPYTCHERQYAYHGSFLWQSPRPEPKYRHAEMRRFWVEKEHGDRARVGTLGGIVGLVWGRAWQVVEFYLSPASVLLLLLFLSRRHPLKKVAVGAVLFAFAGMCLSAFMLRHYSAPFSAVLFLLAAWGWRQLDRMRGWLQPRARTFSVAMLMALVPLMVRDVVNAPTPEGQFGNWKRLFAGELNRNAPGRHLVFVEYVPGHSVNWEFVYNRADIDNAPIIWAHDLGRDNLRLMQRYPDRVVWKIRVGEGLEEDPKIIRRPFGR